MSEIIYKVGRIYKLVSPSGLVYVGSTTSTLAQRLKSHRYHYKGYLKGVGYYITSFQLFEESEDVKIEVLEEHSEISKLNLQLRERYFIENIDCVNKYIPIRSKEELTELKKEYNKDYRMKNAETLREYHTVYNKQNAKTISAKKKEYYKKVADDKKEYYIENRDKIKASKAEKTICEICNSAVAKSGKARHRTSKKCQKIFNITYNISASDEAVINISK